MSYINFDEEVTLNIFSYLTTQYCHTLSCVAIISSYTLDERLGEEVEYELEEILLVRGDGSEVELDQCELEMILEDEDLDDIEGKCLKYCRWGEEG